MYQDIAGIHYPKYRISEQNENGFKYIFQLENGKNFELSVEGISPYRFLYADNDVLVTRKGTSVLVFSADGGQSWNKTKEFEDLDVIQQVYKLSNGNYLVGALDGNQLSNVYLLDKNLEILAKNQLGNMCWHSPKAIDETEQAIMYAEYQNFSRDVALPEEVSIYRSLDRGYTWNKVLSMPHPEGIRHWHTLQADPYRKGHWIATSGDTPAQSRWFVTKDDGNTWKEITDLTYKLSDVPQRSLSAHRTTSFIVNEEYYYFASDDLMGSVPEYFLTHSGHRKSSSKFYRATKTEPVKLEKLTNLGIHARCMIDTGEGYLFITEAKYVSYNSQVYYVAKERLDTAYFLFNINARRRHSGPGSMHSEMLQDGVFYTYTARKTFLDSDHQLLKWSLKYIDNIEPLTYHLEDYIKFDEKLWFFNKSNTIKSLIFFDNHVRLELNDTEDVFYMMLGDRQTDSLGPKKLFEMNATDESIVIEVSMKKNGDSKVGLFIQQYDKNDNKISSKSYPINPGKNEVDFDKEESAKYLKLLLRINNEKNDIIELSNLSIKQQISDENAHQKLNNSEKNHLFECCAYEEDSLSQEGDIDLQYDRCIQHKLKLDDFQLDMLSYFKKRSDKFIVFFNGAVDVEKTPPPVFQRWSWLEKLPYSSLIIMDPTIFEMQKQMDDKTFIGWYQGSYENFILEKIVIHVQKIIKTLNIRPENVVFYGSSAGGFASMVSAGLLRGSKACVVNPQVDIMKYHKKYTDKLLKFLEIDSHEKLRDMGSRFDVIELFKERGYFPPVFYKQNELDHEHYEKHYLYFKKEYERFAEKGKLHSVIFRDKRGHSAIPLFDEAKIDLDRVFDIFYSTEDTLSASSKKVKKTTTAECIIENKYFGFMGNESSINNFKPRKDVVSYKLAFPLNWNVDPFNDRNWCFQLHSWRMLDRALIEFEQNRRLELVNDIFAVIKDWYDFTIVKKNETEYTWYDMSTGLRALKLAYLVNRLFTSNDLFDKFGQGEIALLNELAYIHLDSLIHQKISLNNHGIFQAHGLLLLAWTFTDEEKIKYSIEKMEMLIQQQFNSDGYHSENSDKYHWFVLDTFKKFLPFEGYQGSTLIKKVLELAEQTKKWTVFPNSESLMIGDSEYKTRNVKNASGENHKQPLIKYFEDSGYLFIRSDFDVSEDKASMLFMQTAYKNNVHRHADDFNLLLYEYGINILVDAGQYAYTKDKARGYVQSTRAHNTLMIDGTNYDVQAKDFYKSALEYCDEENGVFKIKTSLRREKLGVLHNRHIFYKPGKFCIVIDKLDSNEERRYDQFWHFHQDLELAEKNLSFTADINEKISMVIEPTIVNLDQTNVAVGNAPWNVKLIKGQTEPELQGWRSLKYKELIENFALQNTATAKKALLITKFLFTEKGGESHDVTLDLTQNENAIFCTIASDRLGVESTIEL